MEKFDTMALQAKITEIADKELGNGISAGHDITKYLCPFHAEKTPSFYVYGPGTGSTRGPHYHCFGCGTKGDTIDLVRRLHNLSFQEACRYLGAGMEDPVKVDQFRAEREAKAAALESQKEAQRETFFTSGVWRDYHAKLDEPSRLKWRSWGIPDEYQNAWYLGFEPELPYQTDEGLQTSPAHVMPMWTFRNGVPPRAITCQFRLANPVAGAGRFRFKKGLGTAPFIARFDWKAGETEHKNGVRECLVVEGPRKAACTYINGTNGDIQVIGIPSKCDTGGIIPALQLYELVYVWLDPDVVIRPKNASDGWEPSDIKLCRLIGAEKARYVRYPLKIDDALIDKTLTRGALRRILNQASGV